MSLDHIGPVATDGADEGQAIGVSRRTFLKASVAGGGFVLGFGLPAFALGATAGKAASFEPNAFIRIGSDGSVTMTDDVLAVAGRLREEERGPHGLSGGLSGRGPPRGGRPPRNRTCASRRIRLDLGQH